MGSVDQQPELILCLFIFYCVCLQPGQHAKELNPYWRDGGTGLPSERDQSHETTQIRGIKS